MSVEEIVLKVIRRDIVIRFNSLTFSWTSLSGFQSTGIPLFAQVALSSFHLFGCTDFFILSLIFSRTFVVRWDALVLPRCVNLASLLCVVSFDYVRVRRVWQVVTVHGG